MGRMGWWFLGEKVSRGARGGPSLPGDERADSTPAIAAGAWKLPGAECLIHQANYLLDQQIRRLEQDFLKEGGIRERMARARRESLGRGQTGAERR